MKRTVMILLAFALSGCSPLVKINAHFTTFNFGDEIIVTRREGSDIGPEVPPTDSREFDATVEVPDQDNGSYSTGPSVNQQQVVSVSLSVRSKRTGKLLVEPIICQAGGTTRTRLIYNPRDPNNHLRCQY
ncbi:hypothetical protein KW785_01570 [Candidatus Parcubacteria bacterium]|nr:hypothetical protein [Candidatus Parcubacteria bacterium]